MFRPEGNILCSYFDPGTQSSEVKGPYHSLRQLIQRSMGLLKRREQPWQFHGAFRKVKVLDLKTVLVPEVMCLYTSGCQI